MKPIGCPKTSVRKYKYTLRNIPEERRSHLRRGGGLKSLKKLSWSNVFNDFIQITLTITWHKRGKEIITDVMVGSDEVAVYCYTEIRRRGDGAAKYMC
jgi:hypothetical protein